MPARVTIRRANGSAEVREIPVETWLAGATHVNLVVTGDVTEVTIDAEGRFPDVDRTNNQWTR
jgi:hypothetical protein